MWGNMRDALLRLALPKDEDIKTQLTQREYNVMPGGQISLESKRDMAERGVQSPDIVDALALTFAQNVAPGVRSKFGSNTNRAISEYDIFREDVA